MTSTPGTTTAVFGLAPSEFRLPAATRVGGVRLQVADLQRSLAYYTDVIGLQIITTSGDTAALGVPGSDAALVTLHGIPGTRPVPRRGAFGLFHFAILLPERAALGRFLAHLGSTGVRVEMADHKVSEALYLNDPDGLGIEAYADRPRETWKTVDRQLVMATDPLDVRSVVAAGGDTAWDGVPAGTTMGHVHLHVGDLEQAAAFYHRTIGFDITAWNYPGALFLSAGGYHHHLGTNTWSPGPAPAADVAQLLEWTLIVPASSDAQAVGERLLEKGQAATVDGQAWTVADPWGTRMRVTGEK